MARHLKLTAAAATAGILTASVAVTGCGNGVAATASSPATKAAANLAVVQRAADLYNHRDWKALGTLYSPAFVDHSARPGQRPGYRGFVDTTQMETIAFPDWVTHLDRVVADDQYVTEMFTGTGTQTGPLQGLPATGRHVRITGTRTYRVQNGKITDTWLNDDELGLLTQLGMVQISPPKK